jgi:hypothetical protein
MGNAIKREDKNDVLSFFILLLFYEKREKNIITM